MLPDRTYIYESKMPLLVFVTSAVVSHTNWSKNKTSAGWTNTLPRSVGMAILDPIMCVFVPQYLNV